VNLLIYSRRQTAPLGPTPVDIMKETLGSTLCDPILDIVRSKGAHPSSTVAMEFIGACHLLNARGDSGGL